jgi:hypothetical protein
MEPFRVFIGKRPAAVVLGTALLPIDVGTSHFGANIHSRFPAKFRTNDRGKDESVN